MAKVLPTTLYPGYDLLAANDTVTVAGVFIPLSSLPALSQSEADPATGDGMEVLRAVNVAAESVVSGLATPDKPTKMTISKQPPKFLNNGNWQETFIINTELVFDSNAATLASE